MEDKLLIHEFENKILEFSNSLRKKGLLKDSNKNCGFKCFGIKKLKSKIFELFPNIPKYLITPVSKNIYSQKSFLLSTKTDSVVSNFVVAYIRHNHTDYDVIIKTIGNKLVARVRAKEMIYKVFNKWKGENKVLRSLDNC